MKNTGRRFIAASVLVLTLLSVMIPVLNAKPEQVLGANQIYVKGLGKLTYMGSHGGQDAYMDENRNMIIQGSFHHNPNATLSYHTSDYFLTVDKTYGTPKNQKWVSVPVNPYGEDEVVGDKIYCSFIIRRSDLERALDELYGDGAANERTLAPYISSRFILKKRNNPGEEWRYDYSKYYDSKADILAAANWSEGTKLTFESCYDTQLTFNFVKYNITVKANPEEGGTAWCDKDDNKAYGGEDVKLYANPNKNYKFRGWTVESGGMSITNAGSAVDAGFNMPNMNVVVRANFEYIPPPPTPIPSPGVTKPVTPDNPLYTVTVTYNDGGIAYSSVDSCYAGETVYLYASSTEGYDFGGWTVTQGETLTGLNRTSAETSFTMPKSDVVINASFSERSIPPENKDVYNRNIRYYTTDAGYTMRQIYGNDGALAVGSDSITNSYYTRLDTYYSVYWESDDTAWYYIPSGTKALYVHPYVYKGYYVDTESIKYITELTFPDTLGPYTVTSIGGGTDKYRTYDSIRYTSGYPIEVGTFDKSGSYSWYDYYYYTESNPYYRYSHNAQLRAGYHYGVIGNGAITSTATTRDTWSSGGKSTHDYREEEESYYVYNTTLKSVTIPSTVTRIEDYAFYNCQALEEVKGGENVTGIGKYAFACAETRSYTISENKSVYSYVTYDYSYWNNTNYYYNGSTSTTEPTATMIKWKESVRVPEYCKLASFPRLGTIYEYAFFLRNNLVQVVLPTTVTSIGANAFAGCNLTSITIPGKNAQIADGSNFKGIDGITCDYGAAATLGTKGAVEDKTQIITVPESNSMFYGLKHDNYYALRAGHKITYHKNASPVETYESATRLEIMNKKVKMSAEGSKEVYNTYNGGTTISNRYEVYITEDGGLWLRQGSALFPTECVRGTKFKSVQSYVVSNCTSYNTDQTKITFSVAIAENGTVWRYLPGGSWVNMEVPEGSTGHQWCDYVYSTSNSKNTIHYLYYLNSSGHLCRIPVYENIVYYEGSYYNFLSGTEVLNSETSMELFCAVPNICDSQPIVFAKGTTGVYWRYKKGWTTTNTYRQVFYGRTSTSSTTYNYATNYDNVHIIDAYGNLLLGRDVNSERSNIINSGTIYTILSDKNFIKAETVTESHTILTDAAGGIWGYNHNSAKAPQKLFDDATVKGVWDAVSSSYQDYSNSTVTKYYYTLLVLDSKNRIWAMTNIRTHEYVWSSGYSYDTWSVVAPGCIASNIKEVAKANDSSGYVYMIDGGGAFWVYKDNALSNPVGDSCMETFNKLSIDTGYEFHDTIYDNMFTPPAGMKFLGWTTNADGSGAKYYPGDVLNVTAPLNLYAQWGPSTKTIKYLPNGGTGYMAEDVYQTAAAMEIVTLKANTFTRRGYEFAGWSLAPNPGVTDTIFGDKSKIALTVETLTLYAQWTPITYTVKVGTDDYRNTTQGFSTHTMQLDTELSLGIKAAKTYTVNYDINKDISMSTQPFYVTVPTTEHTRASLAFSGWRLYEDTNGDGKITLPEDKHLDTFRANTTVKNLTSKKDVTLYIFPYWGGSASYVKLPEITCTGYDLIGYTSGTAYAPDTFATEAQLSNAVKSNILVMAPVGSGAKYQPKTNGENLYAYYRPKDYKVELVVDIPGAKPGDIIQNQSAVTMTFDEIIPNVQPPESSHYIFFGYYTEPGGKGRKYYDERGIGLKEWKEEEESVTKLYAHMISEVTVKLCGRGATKQEQMSVVMTYDKTGPDVIPPEKTGYKFKGYYTKTRGNGTKYFDENGKGATVWTETDVDTLYACWEQNPVELPDKDATGVPEAEPGERVQIRAERKESEVEIYADDYNALTDAYTDAGPYLVSDIVSDGRLEAAGGIPSVENVAMRAKTGAWMFFCTLEKKSGIDMIPAYVTVPYRIQYENSEDESLVISEVRSETVTVMVPKAWSYWIVEEGGLYYPEKVFVENEALKDKREELFVAWDTEDAVKKPSYQRGIYGEKEEHLAWKHVDGNGMPCLEIWIDKEQYIISNVPDTEPEVEDYLSVVAYNAAWADKTQFEARSDLLAVDGIAVLSDAWSGEGNGAAPDTEGVDKIRQAIPETVYSQIYKSGISLAVTAKNGRYESKAVVKYVAAEKNEGRNIEQAVTWVNEINIHTPVVCIPELCAKHDGMYQCEELPEESTVLVLDEEGVHSDFTLHISNTGYHCDKQGYGTRSYTKYLAVKAGTEQNEVNFPFDVWMDVGNDKEKENDVLLDKETWYTLGTETQRFYVPFWTTEGVYDIKVRSVAVNVTADADKTERLRNSVTEHYVAVNQVQVYITGRLYDFTVYNVSGTSAWKEAGEGAVYTVGVKNKEQDSRTTLPLRTGVHPKYRNAGGLPAGGSFSFRLKSVGSFFENGTKLTIYPIFLLLTKEGRIPADVYFEEETDRGVFLKKWNHTEYACQLFAETDSVAGKDTALRDWYGTFSLPDALYIAEYGTDVLGYQKRYGLSFTEEFWIYEERLLLQFEIRIENKKGEVLYYGKIPERIKNNIWCTEAGAGERADSAGMRYEIRGGEVAVIYPGESAAGDYTVHGIY